MYIHVYTYTPHTHINTCIDTCTEICTCTPFHLYIHTNIHIYLHAYMYTYIDIDCLRITLKGDNGILRENVDMNVKDSA